MTMVSLHLQVSNDMSASMDKVSQNRNGLLEIEDLAMYKENGRQYLGFPDRQYMFPVDEVNLFFRRSLLAKAEPHA